MNMKRFVAPAILLLVLFACGKKEEPASEGPPAPPTQTDPGVVQSPAVSPSQTRAEPASPSGESVKLADGNYIVAKGDTLYGIAKKNSLDYRDLAKWNELEDPNRLRVGQELRLKPPGN